jgi:hypothetical protein
MLRDMLLLLALFTAAPSPAAKPKAAAISDNVCPKTKKEWQARGPQILVAKALRQHAPVEVPDFAAKIGKKGGGATGKAYPYKSGKIDMALVEARDNETSLFLSGVLKCDPEKKMPLLVSLTYVKGEQSGFVKVIEE